MNVISTRVPWPAAFPEIVIHGDLKARNRHPNLTIAKAGNAEAALALVRDLLSDTALGGLQGLLKGRRPFVVPVAAIEEAGFNAIPDAMAQEIGGRLGLDPVAGSILQSNKVAHTRAGIVSRRRRRSRATSLPVPNICSWMTTSGLAAPLQTCEGTSSRPGVTLSA